MNALKLSKLSAVLCLGIVTVLAGCHKKAVAPAPPTPPQAVAPTAKITVTPSAIEQGKSATLTWTTTDATSISISGIGTVAASGSQSISPAQSANYTVTAKGAGGTVEDTARLTVNAAPNPAPVVSSLTDEQLFEQNMRDVYFDYDKFDMRAQDSTVAEQDAAFLAKHPDMKLLIAGHCDERGSEEYNVALGENRAEALQKALVSGGVPASRIRVISYGKEKPFCTDSDEQCYQQNRRDHVTLDR